MDNSRDLLYAEKLGKMIRTETISVRGVPNKEKFARFHELLYGQYPKFFTKASVENFDGSLLIRWKGESEKEPIMLMSHMDVVEASGEWKHGAFSGDIADGRLWGRGTLDTKGNLFAILQACEELASEGFTPSRDVYIESACTEEIDGSGADMISTELERRGIRFAMTLDEGGMIMYDPIGGADGLFAMIGVGEKDCVDLKFKAHSTGGHASTPGRNTPLVRLGKFMTAVEKSSIFRTELSPVVEEMFLRFSPYMKGAMKVLFANAGKLKPILCKVMPMVSPTAGAMLRTTLAFTMCKGSDGTNVLPQEAYVVGNMRVSHHQGKKDSVGKVTRLAKKFGLETEMTDPGFESPVSDFHGEGFKLVEAALGEVFPDVVPVPYIMTGASDSRYYSRVCDQCIRFAPFTIDEQQLGSIHGIDENVSIDTLSKAVDFFRYIIKEA